MVAIIGDGYENASTRFAGDQVRTLSSAETGAVIRA